MLSPTDIQALGLRKYPAILRAIAAGQNPFPIPIRFGQPSPTADWTLLQSEITALAQAEADSGYSIAWEEKNTRRWGRQRLPIGVSFADEADYLRMLGKTAEVRRFREHLDQTLERLPVLANWLTSHAPKVVEYAKVWPHLLLVCEHLLANPRPNLYPRELPVAVDTKFVENHRPILRSLLDTLLPPSAVDVTAESFEARFGLRTEEPLVRLRLLDSALPGKLGQSLDDFATPLSRLQALDWSDLRVLIVENKLTFLTLPPLSGTVAIWGAGNAAALLASMAWLHECNLYYWGDLDVHGFHILSRLRRTFPQITSLLMDGETLASHSDFHVPSPPAPSEDTENLSSSELHTYRLLRSERILLEQERLPHALVLETLKQSLP